MTTFEYLAVFVSIVVGLAVVRLLRGVVTITTGRGPRPYWVHTTWLTFHLVWLPYFWWFTFGWRTQELWTFFLFFFVVAYSMLVYVLIAVLVPDDLSGLRDYEEYYFRVRRPFFGLLALLMAMDGADSVLKGPDNLDRLGTSYFPVLGLWTLGHLIASQTDSRRYHGVWAVAYLLIQVLWSMGVWAAAFPAS